MIHIIVMNMNTYSIIIMSSVFTIQLNTELHNQRVDKCRHINTSLFIDNVLVFNTMG